MNAPKIQNTLFVMITMAKTTAEKAGDDPEARLRAAMEECLRYNIYRLDKGDLFKAAVVAATETYEEGSTERKTIENSALNLAALNLMLAGKMPAPADMVREPSLPLMKIWYETIEKVGA